MTTQAERPDRPSRPPMLDDEDRPGPPPLLADEPKGDSRALTVFIAMFALLAFAGVVWFAYDQGRQAVSIDSTPLITADKSPTKIRPSEPGGLQVPHRDKLVLNNIDNRAGAGSDNGVERLLPPPEPPITPTPSSPTSTAPTSTAPSQEGGASSPPGSSVVAAIPPARIAPLPPPTLAVPVPNAAPKPPVETAPVGSTSASSAPNPVAPNPVAPNPVAPRSEPSIPPAPTVGPLSTPAASPQQAAPPSASGTGATPDETASSGQSLPPVPTPRTQALASAAAVSPAPISTPTPAARAGSAVLPPAAALPAGNFRVQIGALRTQDAARAEWQRVQNRYDNVLSGLRFFVERVETGNGVFWRAQGGPMTESAARSACGSLSAAGQACIVVRR